MSDVIDSIASLSHLIKDRLDAKQRTLLLEAAWTVLKEERAEILGELVESALAKWQTLKSGTKSKSNVPAMPALTLASLKDKVVAAAQTTRAAIAEKGAVAVIKEATSNLTEMAAALNRVRTEVTAILAQHDDATDQPDRAAQAAAFGKVLGLASLILIDQARRSRSEVKGEASLLIDRISTILLAEEALIAIVLLQVLGSVIKRAEKHLPAGEPAHELCAELTKLHDLFSSFGAEYLISLKITGLEAGSARSRFWTTGTAGC